MNFPTLINNKPRHVQEIFGPLWILFNNNKGPTYNKFTAFYLSTFLNIFVFLKNSNMFLTIIFSSHLNSGESKMSISPSVSMKLSCCTLCLSYEVI